MYLSSFSVSRTLLDAVYGAYEEMPEMATEQDYVELAVQVLLHLLKCPGRLLALMDGTTVSCFDYDIRDVKILHFGHCKVAPAYHLSRLYEIPLSTFLTMHTVKHICQT